MKRVAAAGLPLFAVAFASALVLAEAGLRLRYFGPAGVTAWRRHSPRPIVATRPPFCCQKDVEPLRLLPATSGYFKGAPFSVNVHGMRDVDYPLRKPRGVCRVAALGDSFTMGSGVRLEDTYVKALERRLNAGTGGTRWEVLNFGVGGYELKDESARRASIVAAFAPDLVLIGMNEANDLPVLNEPAVAAPAPYYRFLRLMPDSFLAELADYAYMARREADWIVRAQARLDWPEFERQLRALRAAGRRGPPVVVALLQDLGARSYPWSPRARRALAASGLPVVDTAPAFAGRDLRRFWIYASDAHPDAQAHALYAQAIHEGLRAGGLLSVCGPPRPTP